MPALHQERHGLRPQKHEFFQLSCQFCCLTRFSRSRLTRLAVQVQPLQLCRFVCWELRLSRTPERRVIRCGKTGNCPAKLRRKLFVGRQRTCDCLNHFSLNRTMCFLCPAFQAIVQPSRQLYGD